MKQPIFLKRSPFGWWTRNDEPTWLDYMLWFLLWPLRRYQARKAKRKVLLAIEETKQSMIYSIESARHLLDDVALFAEAASKPVPRNSIRSFFAELDKLYGAPQIRFISTDPLLPAARLPD